MAIKTLIRDSLANLEVIIEKSDTGKIFFGVKRDEPMTRECYTFDAVQMPGRMLELRRESLVNDQNGTELHVEFNIVINPKKQMIAYSSGSHPNDKSRAAYEIERAYKLVSMYRNSFLKNKDKVRDYPEVAIYLSHICVYPKDRFGKEYKFC